MTAQHKKVIIISSNKMHLARDKTALRRLPLEMERAFSSAAEALTYLSATPVDIVFCDHETQDLEALHFVRTMKSSPGLRRIPVVLVTMRNDRADVLDAVAAGCAGYILRPYSDETFEKHCQTALQIARFNEIEQRQLNDARLMLETGEFEEAIEEFQELANMQGDAQKYYDLGCQHLADERFGKAIVSFQKAIRINDLFAEAYEGLAEAYKRSGKIDRYQEFLKKSAELYAEADKMDKVKEVFVDILKMDDNATNPFNTLGVRLRKSGDISGAVRAYKQALELTPNDENIYYNLAKAFFFSKRYESALEWVTMALRISSNFPEAQKMYQKLKGEPWPVVVGAPGAAGKERQGRSLLLRDEMTLQDDDA